MNGRRGGERVLLLFDIDGTLLSAGKVSRLALEQALHLVYGTSGPIDQYEYSGKTDPQIVRELMRGAELSDAEIDRGLVEALSVYRKKLAELIEPEHVRSKPGVAALLDALEREAHVTLALLTGNLEPCARVKLEPLRLNRYFPFGAYGSDHADRYQLPEVAVRRAHEALGHRFVGKRVVIIGDSIHDVRCGASIGVRAVGVATGPTTRETLAAEKPDALLDDFSDTAAAVEAILGE